MNRLFDRNHESEAKVRDHFVDECKRWGFFQKKLEAPPTSIHDRLVLIKGRAFMVELKANGEGLRRNQRKFHEDLAKMNAVPLEQQFVVDSRSAVDDLLLHLAIMTA